MGDWNDSIYGHDHELVANVAAVPPISCYIVALGFQTQTKTGPLIAAM